LWFLFVCFFFFFGRALYAARTHPRLLFNGNADVSLIIPVSPQDPAADVEILIRVNLYLTGPIPTKHPRDLYATLKLPGEFSSPYSHRTANPIEHFLTPRSLSPPELARNPPVNVIVKFDLPPCLYLFLLPSNNDRTPIRPPPPPPPPHPPPPPPTHTPPASRRIGNLSFWD